MLIVNVLLIFLLSLLLFYGVLVLIFIRKSAATRLAKYFNTEVNTPSEDNEKKEFSIKLKPRKMLNVLGEKISGVTFIKKYNLKVQQELIKAGLPLKGEEFLAIQVLISLCIMLIVINTTKSVFAGIIISFSGWMLPNQIVKVRKSKRYKLFNDQLGDAIVLISNSLKAGHSFLQAVDSVVREMPEPISKEFEKLLREMRLGMSTEQALENLLDRVESDDLELMITAVLIQRQIGGNLSEILDKISNTIRERVRLKGEIQTLTAQGRLSGIIVSLLPFGLSIILYLINPDYLKSLFQNSFGMMILGMALINELIGIVLINKIVKIEV